MTRRPLPAVLAAFAMAVAVAAGVAVAAEHRAGDGGDDVIRAADRALHQGKAARRDRVVAASDHPGLDG